MESHLNLKVTEDSVDNEPLTMTPVSDPKETKIENPKPELGVIKSKSTIPNDPNNGWTEKKVKQLKKKMDQLKILRYLHKKVASDYSRLNDILSLPNITIEFLVGGTLFASLSEKISDDARFWLNLILGLIAMIGGIFGVWIKYFKANEKMHAYANASREYSNIYDDIDDQLALEPHERVPGKDYLRHIKKMISQQDQKDLDISQKYWDDYFESVSKGELINLNYTLIDPEKDDETIIEIDPEIVDGKEDAQSGDIGNCTTLTTTLGAVHPPEEIHDEEEDLGPDMVRFHFNKMAKDNLKKNLRFQMARWTNS